MTLSSVCINNKYHTFMAFPVQKVIFSCRKGSEGEEEEEGDCLEEEEECFEFVWEKPCAKNGRDGDGHWCWHRSTAIAIASSSASNSTECACACGPCPCPCWSLLLPVVRGDWDRRIIILFVPEVEVEEILMVIAMWNDILL